MPPIPAEQRCEWTECRERMAGAVICQDVMRPKRFYVCAEHSEPAIAWCRKIRTAPGHRIGPPVVYYQLLVV